MNYGKAIRTIRSARNMSRNDLSNRLGVVPSYLFRIENGERQPSAKVLQKLTEELNIPFYLLVLLSSDQDEVDKLPAEEKSRLGEKLLELLIASEKTDGK